MNETQWTTEGMQSGTFYSLQVAEPNRGRRYVWEHQGTGVSRQSVMCVSIEEASFTIGMIRWPVGGQAAQQTGQVGCGKRGTLELQQVGGTGNLLRCAACDVKLRTHDVFAHP